MNRSIAVFAGNWREFVDFLQPRHADINYRRRVATITLEPGHFEPDTKDENGEPIGRRVPAVVAVFHYCDGLQHIVCAKFTAVMKIGTWSSVAGINLLINFAESKVVEL